MSAPAISIVTPVKNGATYLPETLASVLGQNYAGLEYVVQDGGSTDGTCSILQGYETSLSWMSCPDRGLYDALNKGFARTKGEVMGYLNADDRLLPGALSVVGDIFSAFPQIEWITSLYPLTLDARGRIVRCHERPGFSARLFRAGAYLPSEHRPGAFWIQQESTFWRRSLWERAGGFFDDRLGLAGDFDLWRRFFETATLYGVAAPLGCFRRHPSQLTASASDKYRQEAEAVLAGHGVKPWGPLRWLAHRVAQRVVPRRLSRPGPILSFDPAGGAWLLMG